ncbi:MAG: flavin reductase family protein [Bdellovibrionota bacterium]
MVNANWKPGDPIPSPVEKMIELDPAQLDSKTIYKVLIGGIVPRPIAFISTLSASGVGNLAPFSFFNGVSSRPPAIMVAITRNQDGSKKDTLRNIEETRQFVVNSVNEWLVEPMNHCSGNFPYGVNEMSLVGLTPVPSSRVRPPRVRESAIQLECELYDTMDVGGAEEGASTIVVGRIVMVHVAELVYRDGKILIHELKPISRLGGLSYGRTSDVFDLRRPKI